MRDLAETLVSGAGRRWCGMRRSPAPAAGRRAIWRWSTLTQGEIERLEGAVSGAIEDILPLSPLQEGLLFHALYDAQAPDVYTVQLELELEGALDAARAGRPRCRR